MVLVSLAFPTYLRKLLFTVRLHYSYSYILSCHAQCEQEAGPYRDGMLYWYYGKNRKVYCFVAYSDNSVSAHVLFT